MNTWFISEASAFVKAHDVPWTKDGTGDCARMVTLEWVPREHLEAVRAGAPRLIAVQRVMNHGGGWRRRFHQRWQRTGGVQVG